VLTRTRHPQEGKIIIFYSMLPNGEMDDYSLHGGGGVLFGHCDAALVEHHSLHFRRLRRPLQQRYQVERQLLALEQAVPLRGPGPPASDQGADGGVDLTRWN